MTQEEFLWKYQLLYRKIGSTIQWIVLDKANGSTKKKYRFDLEEMSSIEFEIWTGRKLEEEVDNWFIDQLKHDFNITE